MNIETLLLKPNGFVPNHPALPVIVYRQALIVPEGLAAAFEAEFARNGWQHVWRNGIYNYHHYHTKAHEALGIAGGKARVALGGQGAQLVDVSAGDCLLLPAGTGHCRLSATADFLVIGAYPPGQTADMKTDAPSEADLTAIRDCALPDTDPVTAGAGTLNRLWRM
ncbi:cupin (plasmid) [Rhizobium sp. TH2]|uniref:cupin n=1 Tax=Rhizobium sp. TH2 TaxID=2775403 RepID=UPI0021580053|nr:cupin [Rhizobium sp. TH2]UVC12642.1 cupin [Rhizobium sp. TH2]